LLRLLSANLLDRVQRRGKLGVTFDRGLADFVLTTEAFCRFLVRNLADFKTLRLKDITVMALF